MTLSKAAQEVRAAKAEMDAARPGSMMVAGRDVLIKERGSSWYRPATASYLKAATLAEFHGHSGYAIVERSDV